MSLIRLITVVYSAAEFIPKFKKKMVVNPKLASIFMAENKEEATNYSPRNTLIRITGIHRSVTELRNTPSLVPLTQNCFKNRRHSTCRASLAFLMIGASHA